MQHIKEYHLHNYKKCYMKYYNIINYLVKIKHNNNKYRNYNNLYIDLKLNNKYNNQFIQLTME